MNRRAVCEVEEQLGVVEGVWGRVLEALGVTEGMGSESVPPDANLGSLCSAHYIKLEQGSGYNLHARHAKGVVLPGGEFTKLGQTLQVCRCENSYKCFGFNSLGTDTAAVTARPGRTRGNDHAANQHS